MPFVSKAQLKKCFAEGWSWCKEWYHKTKNPKGLPEHAAKGGKGKKK